MCISVYVRGSLLGSIVYLRQRTIGRGDSAGLCNYLHAQHHLLWTDAPVSVLPFQPAHADIVTAFFTDGGVGWFPRWQRGRLVGTDLPNGCLTFRRAASCTALVPGFHHSCCTEWSPGTLCPC